MHRKSIISITAVLLPFVTYLLTLPHPKISSYSATSQPEILSVSMFFNIAANFQLALQEMKPNSGNQIIKITSKAMPQAVWSVTMP
jgi:hypothetical protein